ncbi:MAG: M81 family metallopeptidase [Fuerstiella sp.]|nr:M81 family metallopeptidase [Fuerstiella sp.]
MRVGIIGLLHESNTFIAEKTTLKHFQHDTLLTGPAIHDRFAETGHELGGFFAGLQQELIEPVPILAARAVPFGPILTEVFQQLLEMMQTELAGVGPLDGILVAPHGATVCESVGDADGYWLAKLREQAGPKMPIIGTLDAHANLSQQMVDATDALIAYRTNPHLDQFERGVDAARLMAQTLRGEVCPVQRAQFPPLSINMERQMTSEPHLTPLYEALEESHGKAGVLAGSILLGFPYSDVEEMGSSVLFVTDRDLQLAADESEKLAEQMWQSRQELDGRYLSMDQAVRQAAGMDGPVCLLDMGDNVGGGSPGDSTHLAHAIRRSDVASALICVFDPDAVRESVAVGVGGTVELKIGGKTDDRHGVPLTGTWTVHDIVDGEFTDRQIRHGGFTRYNQGRSAVIQSTDGQLTVLLNSRRTPPFSLVQLTSCGLNPTQYQIIVAKGVNAPVAAYAPVCRHLIRVNSPGCTTAEMTQLEFRYRRRPMFPFENDALFRSRTD